MENVSVQTGAQYAVNPYGQKIWRITAVYSQFGILLSSGPS